MAVSQAGNFIGQWHEWLNERYSVDWQAVGANMEDLGERQAIKDEARDAEAARIALQTAQNAPRTFRRRYE